MERDGTNLHKNNACYNHVGHHGFECSSETMKARACRSMQNVTGKVVYIEPVIDVCYVPSLDIY